MRDQIAKAKGAFVISDSDNWSIKILLHLLSLIRCGQTSCCDRAHSQVGFYFYAHYR